MTLEIPLWLAIALAVLALQFLRMAYRAPWDGDS